MIATNMAAVYESQFEVPMAGAVINCINIRVNATAIAFVLSHGSAAAVIVDQELLPLAEKALKIMEDNNMKGKFKPPILIVIGHDETCDAKEIEHALRSGAIEYEKFYNFANR